MREIGAGEGTLSWDRMMTRRVRVFGAIALGLWSAAAALSVYRLATDYSDSFPAIWTAMCALLLSVPWLGMLLVRNYGRSRYPEHFERMHGRPPTDDEARYWRAGSGDA